MSPQASRCSYRMVDDGRVKQLNYQVGQGDDHHRRQGAQATKVTARRRQAGTLWVVDGMPVPARILRARMGRTRWTCACSQLH
jgi:hypothetical protein